MNESFALDHHRLRDLPDFAALAEDLAAQTHIDSAASFNRYCQEACQRWGLARGKTSSQFRKLLGRIDRRERGTIRTPWGGVVVTRQRPPRVEKYLVIRQGGYLALEKHELKDERLDIVEGAGLLLSRRGRTEPLAAEALAPGRQFHFEPGMEHCLIGTENLLVFERSMDPKGMDQDLIFLYEPEPAGA